MSNTSLSEFAGRLRTKNRITFADVQRLAVWLTTAVMVALSSA
jgi:hypothetical protein